jgi:hypothetical protein
LPLRKLLNRQGLGELVQVRDCRIFHRVRSCAGNGI